MSAWVLPDHIADVLPSEARHIEEVRRDLLDMARCYGYELVMPPLLEHLESLLTGTGEALDLHTFKLVDQLSGRRKLPVSTLICSIAVVSRGFVTVARSFIPVLLVPTPQGSRCSLVLKFTATLGGRRI